MNKITLGLMYLAVATSAPMVSAATSASQAAPAAAARGVDDPRAFVARTYAAYARAPGSPPADQSFAYSPSLRALYDAYDAWQAQHQDLVGSVAFDWWTNSQDWGELVLLDLTEEPQGADRRTIVARFRNFDVENVTRFPFVRENGRWFLDDAVHGSGGGDDGWTLSALLRERSQ